MVPLPKYKTDIYEHSNFDGSVYLTPEALHDLRSKINAEKKVRRKAWIDWLAAFTGIIGALIGLIAINK
jgi:hypothetical protein